MAMQMMSAEKKAERDGVLRGHMATHEFDGKLVVVTSICVMPEGLMVERAHHLSKPMLASEIGEARALQSFVPSTAFRDWISAMRCAQFARDNAGDPVTQGMSTEDPPAPETAGAIFSFEIGEADCLALDVSAANDIAVDRVLFRKVRFTGRRIVSSDEVDRWYREYKAR